MFSANSHWRITVSSISTPQRSYDAEKNILILNCLVKDLIKEKKKEHTIENPKEDTQPSETKDGFKTESTFHQIL